MPDNSKLIDTNEQSNYDEILRKEKRFSTIRMYAMPIVSFISLFLAITITHSPFSVLVIIPIGLVYSTIFMFHYLPLPPKKYSAKNPVKAAAVFFRYTGFEKMVIRCKILDKQYSNYVQFLIFVGAFVAIMMSSISSVKVHNENLELVESFLSGILIVPILMIMEISFIRGALRKHKDFGLCYSVGCFRISSNFESVRELEKINYMIDGLKYYNYYIRKNLKLRINNLDTSYPLLIADSKESVKSISDSILITLQGEKLDLLRYLISHSKISENIPILVSEQITTRIKDGYQLIISGISAIVGIITIILSLIK